MCAYVVQHAISSACMCIHAAYGEMPVQSHSCACACWRALVTSVSVSAGHFGPRGCHNPWVVSGYVSYFVIGDNYICTQLAVHKYDQDPTQTYSVCLCVYLHICLCMYSLSLCLFVMHV